MAIYQCYLPIVFLGEKYCRDIAHALKSIHSEMTGTPESFVEFRFAELSPLWVLSAGDPSLYSIVNVFMKHDGHPDRRLQLKSEITAAFCRIVAIPPQNLILGLLEI